MPNYIRLSCDNGELIRNRSIFSVLADDTVAALEKICRNKTIRAGNVIFRQGDDANHYFGVTSGIIKLVKSLANGNQSIVGLPDPPIFVGYYQSKYHTYS
jgi:CRP/FNR family transcriptional regulator